MRQFKLRDICAVVCVGLAMLATQGYASAQDVSSATASERAGQTDIKTFMASLHPEHGNIKLPEGDAELHLGQAYYFLNQADAKRVITEAWGNPPSNAEGVMGMIVPEGSNPIENWGAIVTYEKTDYISDKDADKTDYNKLVKQIQDGEAEDNAQRKKDGYGTMHLVGWAQAPTYDKVSHTMIWARDLQVEGNKTDSLNYDIRLLGRRGVLSLNMIAFMPELPTIKEQARDLAKAGVFTTGARYEDYAQGDAKAAYGIAGLVAAGLGIVAAKKLGLLAILLLVAKKGYILVVAGLAAVRMWWAKLFGKKPKTEALPVGPDVLPSEAESLNSESVEAVSELPVVAEPKSEA